ncbi:MAG: putative baseplate assembly protein [Acidobacteriota bacterium]|nr:MAG: putative baseplate assembly protein [Acidobacteriota bacterium]
MNDLICQNEKRREAVRKQTQLFGLDYLEVGEDQRTLSVHFLGKAPGEIGPDNVVIEGGRRIRNIRVVGADPERTDDPELDDTLEVVVDRPGDFSTYTLRIVERDERGHPQPHPKFDPRYDSVEFGFKVDCAGDLDCKAGPLCPPAEFVEPEINYLAKDYASFRQLIFDRLALVMPDWKERHVPDIGVALVELLAYTGDYLSYYQDAVATEAYLDTARQRISVRRHARLVDYRMHEGSNARAWVTVEVLSDLELQPRDTFFITASTDPASTGIALKQGDLRKLVAGSYEVFEPMIEQTNRLYQSHNEIHFYTWGDDECCLDRGATSATLVGELAEDEPPPDESPDECDPPQEAGESARQTQPDEPPVLHLRAGDVLIFEEVIGPGTGNTADADPAHRHAVRLTRVTASTDPLNGQPIVEVEWAEEDALPFPLCISTLGQPPDCEIIRDVSVARGNVVLVDHGMTVEEDLDEVPVREIVERCKSEGALADVSIIPGRYRPMLEKAPLTFSGGLAPFTPASHSLWQEVHEALPQVWLTGDPALSKDPVWKPQHDLLGSSADDQHFVAEINNDGRAHLRFGDDELGQSPLAGMKFHAVYRVGNGYAGNVGAESITRIVFRTALISGGIAKVRNPMPAVGGTPPEPLAEVKLFAPNAFRHELQRAIVAEDYAAIVKRDFSDKVQRAAATLRWNGSWYEALVAVDQIGRTEADPALLDTIAGRLYHYRRIGHDLAVRTARLVTLDIEMKICVHPHYLHGHVKAALIDLLGSRVLPDGRKGFFHPDNLSFGEGIYLSRLVAAAQTVTGVESVEVSRLERLYEGPNGEIENGLLPLGPLEVAQLDNDPSFPEHGKLALILGGGR